METVTVHHRPSDPKSADLMLRLAIMSRSPSWPHNPPVAFSCRICGQRIDDGKPCGCGAR